MATTRDAYGERGEMLSLWELLLTAQRRVRTRSDITGMAYQSAVAYRNGVLDAFTTVTGRDSEEIQEALQETLIAEHERQISEMDG